MKGRRPFRTRLRTAFAAVAACLGIGIGTGLANTYQDNKEASTPPPVTSEYTFSETSSYDMAGQFWKSTLGVKTQDQLAQELYTAAEAGDSWRLNILLNSNVTPADGTATSFSQEQLQNALLKAARSGQAETVRLLISKNVDVAAQDNAALMEAIYGRNAAATQILLENGADANARSNAALEAAVYSGNVLTVQALLASGASINALDGAALYAAVVGNDTYIAGVLLQSGADPDAGMGRIRAIVDESGSAEMRDLFSRYLPPSSYFGPDGFPKFSFPGPI